VEHCVEADGCWDVFTINLGILHSWTQTSTPAADNKFADENTGSDGQWPPITSASGLPPPADTHTTQTT